MAKIRFDIKYRPQIESGQYRVETKGGVPVHILLFETLGPFPICYQVGDGMDADFPPRPDVYFANNNGECSYTPNSLFIVTPEELTKFEKRLFELRHIANRDMYSVQEWQTLRKESAELLSLAREQFIKDGYVIEKKEFHDAVKKVDPEIMAEVSKAIDLSNFEYTMLRYVQEGANVKDDEELIELTKKYSKELFNCAGLKIN